MEEAWGSEGPPDILRAPPFLPNTAGFSGAFVAGPEVRGDNGEGVKAREA